MASISPANALIEAVLQHLLQKLDLDGVTQTLIEQVGDRIAASIVVSDLADELAKEHTTAILAQLKVAMLKRIEAKRGI